MKYNEGPGLKLSDSLVFHPGLSVEGRYDSNVLNTNSDIRSEVPGGGYLRLIGHLHLATLSPQRLTDGEGKKSPQTVAFRLKSAIGFRNYFVKENTVDKPYAIEVDAGLGLTLFPQGVFSFSFTDDFARTTTFDGSSAGIDRDVNVARATFNLAPGGGRLSFALSYGLGIDYFEDGFMQFGNKLYHEIALRAKWRLLPKTAITLEAIEQINSYMNTGGDVSNRNSFPLRIYAGFVGLISPRLSTVLKVGYGNGLYDTGDSFNSVLAIAELGYQFSPLAKLRGGYEHGFNDSFFANYYTDEKIFLSYDHLIASRFLLNFNGNYRYRQYEGFGGITGTTIPELNNHIVTLGLGFDYQIQEWIYVGIGYDLQIRSLASGSLNLGGAVSNWTNDYTKHQVFGKVGVSY
jgi:hypothetical protein